MLANSEIIERELGKIASTDERKRMWILIDGQRMPKDIATAAKITAQAVSNFLSIARTAELIEYDPRQPPRRILDYVPSSWIELLDLQKIITQPSEGSGSKEAQTDGKAQTNVLQIPSST